MTTALDALSWIGIVVGVGALATAALGLIRLPDFFSRTHAVGILDTLGAGLILLALALQSGLSLVTVKLLLMLIFIWITGTTATHALARAAERTERKPWTAGDDAPDGTVREDPE